MQLEGAVAIVSGGASGLGRAAAEALRERGAEVVVLDLPGTRERVEPDGFAFAPADVRDPDAVAEAVAVATGSGPLRVAVNCAGIGPPGRVLRKGEPLALERFTTTIEINLIGTFNVIRLAAAAMARAELVDGARGVIVNTASIAAFDGQIGQAAYSASKGAIVGMTLPIARDLASSQIRCVTIAPGIFDTPLLGSLPAEARASLGAAVPHPARLGDPAEYAALVVHVAENEMLNGEVIRLDGALRMAPR
jgi:NAD(P)-dependent dehydrogenase (short-subunit alcohol dehydrogenase family)